MKDEAFTNISHDGDDQVRQLLGTLPRVAAPSDFDFRLRSRIAKGRPAQRSGFRLPAAVTYAMGLGVVLVVFGLIGAAWMYSGTTGAVPAVATSSPVSAAVPERVEQVEVPVQMNRAVQNVEIAAKRPETVALPKPTRAGTAIAAPSPENNSSTGILPDAALKTARSIYPKGINPNAGNIAPDANVALGRPIETKEVLSRLGIHAAFSGGGLRVQSVAAGSSAEKGGMKAGDIIQAINGDPVTVRSSFTDRFSAKSLRVVREGQTIKINF
ncbi:MAG: PDZ domain-containing protein [Acidobacteriota bacterium]